MYAGRAVEQAPTRELFAHVRMPYTKALLDAIPRVERPPHTLLPVVAGRPPDLAALPAGCPFAPRCPKAQDMCRETAPPLEEREPGHRLGLLASGARCAAARSRGRERQRRASRCCPRATSCRSSWCAAHGGVKGGVVQAVSDVSFDVRAGETLGIVGETGSGKSTLARSVLQAPRPKSGSVRFQGTDLVGLQGPTAAGGAPLACRWSSRTRSARWTRKWRVAEHRRGAARRLRRRQPRGAPPARARGARHGRPRPRRLRQAPPAPALGRPGPARRHRPRAHARPRAHHLRRGRVVARRPHPGPGPQPLRAPARGARALLPLHRPRPRAGQAGLRPRRGDVPRPAVRARPGRGALPRAASTRTRWRCWPRSPAPTPTRRRAQAHAAISGDPPSPIDPPSGCRFRTRCPRAQERCAARSPQMRELGRDHAVACHFPVTP